MNEEPGEIKDGVSLLYETPGHVHSVVEAEPQSDRLVGGRLAQEFSSVDTVEVAVSPTVSPLTGENVYVKFSLTEGCPDGGDEIVLVFSLVCRSAEAHWSVPGEVVSPEGRGGGAGGVLRQVEHQSLGHNLLGHSRVLHAADAGYRSGDPIHRIRRPHETFSQLGLK